MKHFNDKHTFAQITHQVEMIRNDSLFEFKANIQQLNNHSIFQIIIKISLQIMSNTKRTLLILLKQQLNQLQGGIMNMNEDDLIKNVSKRKVIYNISQQGQLQLIYAQIALAQYYLNKDMLQSANRIVDQSRDIKVVGDTSFLFGSIKLKQNNKQEALVYLQNCIEEEWIQPSNEHRMASKLQAMTLLQKIYFQMGQRQKLIQLSYDKIRLTRQSGIKYSQNYFHALSLADMGIIHQAFGQFSLALQKIEGALVLLEASGQQPLKQIQLYKVMSGILVKMGKFKEEAIVLQKALNLSQKLPNRLSQQLQMQLLERYIETNLYN